MLNDANCFSHIYIACGRTDLRKGIDSLAALIRNEFKLNPFDEGSIFLFCGGRTDRIKALVYEGDGFLLLTKRLSNGKFQWPRSSNEVNEISLKQYRWLMEGLSVVQKKEIHKVKPGLL